MQIVIADTGPLNYLILIGHVEILPALFHEVILPSAVQDELSNPKTPASVRGWIEALPPWVQVRQAGTPPANLMLENLGDGEMAVRALLGRLSPVCNVRRKKSVWRKQQLKNSIAPAIGESGSLTSIPITTQILLKP